MQMDVKLPAGRGAYAVDPEGEEEAERKALLRRRHHQQARLLHLDAASSLCKTCWLLQCFSEL